MPRKRTSPPVGLVWNPHGDDSDTIRVGGAILYDVVETWFNERETTNAPLGANIDTPNPVGGFSNPWQGYPGGNPFPQNGKSFPIAGVDVNMTLNSSHKRPGCDAADGAGVWRYSAHMALFWRGARGS